MSYTYALIAGRPAVLRSDGAVVPNAPSNADWQAYQMWLAAGNTVAPAPAAPNPSTITSGAFFLRFTSTEKAAVMAECMTNSTLMLGLVNGLAQGDIDLTGSVTSSWINALVTAGALTSARATEILTP